MRTLFDSIYEIVLASWGVLLESAPYVLLGFFVAGLFKAFLPHDFITKHLGGKGASSIVKASALGVPVPLCSCGVLPAAAGLKEQGAGKGAVTSFLISTPETGVDSIAVTYALLDPLMTVIRPVVSFFTAVAAGMAVLYTDRNGIDAEPAVVSAASGSSCSNSCCCEQKNEKKQSFTAKLRGGMTFAFGELLQDIGKWFLVGIVLAGMISVFLSPEIVSMYFGNEYLSMLLMLAIAIPLYVCATASTPIAAAFALKGISPGAALVFLLAGPATNIASLTVVSRILGKKAVIVYLAVIIVMSFAAGMVVNNLYGLLGLDIADWIQSASHEDGGIIAVGSSIVLLLLIIRPYLFGNK
ncbi:SO_0444 family Cu/Zn efflux transporter [Prosthecochloris sp. SCSIO W1101]|uniref:SO_0444 family Cu/Zn efflux transporter n=1 Tax=Prosthecochloris sp. SCSIO W1101 TaxID=2992242 RepID=UPI00223CE5A8|nr:SO_0444 family Cu/Zn efflux transporter [Prosthecochloris sp. SCSIO W1101]UZJ42788.1 SO_0444 family Cu/Zn efflux transporter [Prosthecochloris sp. SCSIO W1101]